jgi:hypothetical protein
MCNGRGERLIGSKDRQQLIQSRCLFTQLLNGYHGLLHQGRVLLCHLIHLGGGAGRLCNLVCLLCRSSGDDKGWEEF